MFLLITYSDELVDGRPCFISSNCLPIKATDLEPAGRSFHSAALRLSGLYEADLDPGGDPEKASCGKEGAGDGDNDGVFFRPLDSGAKKGKKQQCSDHYALLGLSHLRYLATEEQIRKSYRETALRHHPDKLASLILAEETDDAKQAKKEEIETRFKSIQEAYEVLIDPTKRRIYDSTDEFDDEIPTDCSPRDFFKVFGPAFLRNGRWSVGRPVPSLGDDSTSLDEVDRFYSFWYGFRSWREFAHEDAFDPEQAESRDHKRWMERQNVKLTEKARKEESARVRSLVDNAYRRDPRINRRREEERAEKQRKREAKALAKRRQEEEAEMAAEESRVMREEEERLAAEAAARQKKTKEKEKKMLRRERNRLRSLSERLLHRAAEFGIDGGDVEMLCSSLGFDRLRAICDEMEGRDETEQSRVIREARPGNDAGAEVDDGPGKPEENGRGGADEEEERGWEREEVELLRKGVNRYPKGTPQRWEVIAEYMGTGRRVEEILKATKTVLVQKPDNAKAYDSFLESRKPGPAIASPLTQREGVGPESALTAEEAWSAVQERALVHALKTFGKDTAQRWDRVAAAVPGKTVNQCKKKFSLLKENFRNQKVGR